MQWSQNINKTTESLGLAVWEKQQTREDPLKAL